MKKIIKKIKLPLIFATIFLLVDSVFAQTNNWSLQVNWPNSPVGTPLNSTSGIAKLVKYFYEWGIAIGIIIFFGMLIYAGFQYITSTGNPDKLKSAKNKIISGFSGVLLLLGSYLILNTINPELTDIRTIDFSNEDVNFSNFQSGLNNEENLCEFAFVTTQEKSGKSRETFFMIPGMSVRNGWFFPTKSIACKPEKNIKEILEVRNNNIKNYYTLVKKYSGEEVISESERVEYSEDENVNEQELQNLYKQRYKKVGEFKINKDDDIKTYFLKALQQQNYNIFGDGSNNACQEYISKEKFNRPRCLIFDRNSGILTEWKRKGYSSLIKAFEQINSEGKLSNPKITHCPNNYVKSSTGSGCSLAFYKGQKKAVWPFGWGDTPSCRNQISRPSASMDHFDGIVDDEANCMQLIRYESPLDIGLPKYTLTVKNNTNNPSKLTLKVGNVTNTVEESTQKSFEAKKYSLITVSGTATSYRNEGCLKLKVGNNCEKETSNFSDGIECSLTLTKNITAILDITYQGCSN